jgi:cell division protein FtsQ
MRRVKAAQKRTSAARRKPVRRARVKPLISRRKLRAGVAALGMAVWAFAAWQVWETGWLQAGGDEATAQLIDLSAGVGFKIEHIDIEGRHETSANDLRAALAIAPGEPIFGFDTTAAHERLKKLPWVHQAAVERHLPDTVLLRITERKPIALWQLDGKFSLIDVEGAVIPIDDVGRFGKLPVVVGAGAPPNAAALIELLASEPDLASRVRAAVRIGDRRWDIHMDERLHVMLPEDDAISAWHRLAELSRTGELLARNYSTIDLRLKDRVVVRKAPNEDPATDPKKRHT